MKTNKKIRRKTLLTVTILLLATTGLLAQTTTSAGGGEAYGSGGTASFAVGQIACHTHSGNNTTVSEGVQQTYEFSITTRIKNKAVSLVQVSAYPNPTTDYLKLSVKTQDFSSELLYQLYDIHGKLLQTQQLTSTEVLIDMSSYVPSTYFIRIIGDNKSIEEFKIAKTQ